MKLSVIVTLGFASLFVGFIYWTMQSKPKFQVGDCAVKWMELSVPKVPLSSYKIVKIHEEGYELMYWGTQYVSDGKLHGKNSNFVQPFDSLSKFEKVLCQP